MATCELCYGKGVHECPMEYGNMRHPENCPACGGDQKVTCTDCNGTGRSPYDDDDDNDNAVDKEEWDFVI